MKKANKNAKGENSMKFKVQVEKVSKVSPKHPPPWWWWKIL